MGKRKKKKLDAAALARRMARAVVGRPPSERVVPSKIKKEGKHKKRELEREFD
ncbi:MAG TPA: hypothetical protein VNN18_11080 [Candidatus Xenobia bacterium]|nr:hypothetical protein [Candidatus Xenobia bacterium]